VCLDGIGFGRVSTARPRRRCADRAARRALLRLGGAPDPNPWLTNRFLNIAHQGGEDEAPSSTLFAFKSAVASRGADMLELDVNLSSDGELMVIHDDTWTRTSCTAALCPGPTSATEPQPRGVRGRQHDRG
jgi:hypothetical protein